MEMQVTTVERSVTASIPLRCRHLLARKIGVEGCDIDSVAERFVVLIQSVTFIFTGSCRTSCAENWENQRLVSQRRDQRHCTNGRTPTLLLVGLLGGSIQHEKWCSGPYIPRTVVGYRNGRAKVRN